MPPVDVQDREVWMAEDREVALSGLKWMPTGVSK